MAKRISELPAAAGVADSDEFELNQSGTSRKATRAQVVDGLASATHAHSLADIADAGALAGKNSVDAADIDGGAVGTTALADGAVTPAKLDRAYAETGHGHADATTGAAGFMSATDKAKVDGIEAGAQVNRPLASQAQAEAGTNNTNVMTSLRTAQAILAQAAPAGHQHTLADVTDAGALATLDTVAAAQIDDDAVTLAKLAHGTADRLLGFSAAGAPAEISAGTGISISGGTITATNGGGAGAPTGAAYLVLSNDGDLTDERALVVAGGLDGVDAGPNGSYTVSIAAGGVTNAKLADMAEGRLKGRLSPGSGVPDDLTAAQAWRILSAPTTLVFGTTVSWNVGAAPIAKLTLAGNCTINASNVPEGQIAILLLHQDATGGRSVTWGTGFSGVDPVHALGANGVSALYFGGTSSGLVMNQVLRASQAEAEAGANNSRMMTPLRVKNSIDTFAAAKTHASSHVTGGDDRIRDATASQDGLMTAAYATKLEGIEAGATSDQAAAEVPYDNTGSGLTAEDVQAAIDELKAGIDAIEPGNGAGLTVTDEKTGAYTAATGELVLTDSSGGAFDVSLPAEPAHGTHIAVLDTTGSWEGQPITLLRNGATIDGFADELLLDGGGRIDLIFNSEQDDWEIASVRGVSGTMGGVDWGAITGSLEDQQDLTAALDAKADAGHDHDGAYAALNHGHAISEVSGLQTALDGKLAKSGDTLADVKVTQVSVSGARTVTSSDSGKTLIYTGAGHTWTFTGSGLGAGCHGAAHNAGTGNLTVSTNRTKKVKGTEPVPPDASFTWEDDGTRLWISVNV